MRDGLITLIFVDWLPPFTYTSRGFLSLGSEVAHLRERSTTCSRIPRPTAAAPRCLSKLMVQYSMYWLLQRRIFNLLAAPGRVRWPK
jgi:hypothetical protein